MAHRAVRHTNKYKVHVSKSETPLTPQQDLDITTTLWSRYLDNLSDHKKHGSVYPLSLLVRHELYVCCAYRAADIDVLMTDDVKHDQENKELTFTLCTNKTNITSDTVYTNVITCVCEDEGHLPTCAYGHLLTYVTLIGDQDDTSLKFVRAMNNIKTKFVAGNLGIGRIKATYEEIATLLDLDLDSTGSRVGPKTAVTTAVNDQVLIANVQAMTHHKSTSSLNRYVKPDAKAIALVSAVVQKQCTDIADVNADAAPPKKPKGLELQAQSSDGKKMEKSKSTFQLNCDLD